MVTCSTMFECTWTSHNKLKLLTKYRCPSLWLGLGSTKGINIFEIANRSQAWYYVVPCLSALRETHNKLKFPKINAQPKRLVPSSTKVINILDITNWSQVWYYVVSCLSALGETHIKLKIFKRSPSRWLGLGFKNNSTKIGAPSLMWILMDCLNRRGEWSLDLQRKVFPLNWVVCDSHCVRQLNYNTKPFRGPPLLL